MNDCDKKASNGKITEKGLIDISKNVVSLVNDGKEIKEDTFRYYFFIEMLKHFWGRGNTITDEFKISNELIKKLN